EEPQEYDEIEEYEEPQEYDEIEEYEEPREYEAIEEYEEPQEYDEIEEYEEPQEYDEIEEYEEPQEYDEAEEYEVPEEDESLYSTKKIDIEIYIPTEEESLYSTREIDLELYEPDDYAEDTESYYENAEEDIYEEGEAEYYASDEYYEDEYVNEEFVEEAYVDEEYIEEEYVNEEYDEDSFDSAYGDFEADYEPDDVLYEDDGGEELLGFWQRVKLRFSYLTAFDAVLASTGVVVLVAAFVILSMFLQSRQINKQIEALAPLGSELKEIGIVGGNGLFAMTDAALSGNFAQAADQEGLNAEDTSSIEVIDTPESTKVNVSFVSVEKDLKIRFTDVNTGALITGTVFEVTLTNAAGKQLVLTDDDMDGIIYAQNVNAGVFDAVVTSTDKYKFPAIAQQVTVKDKVEYVVINVQDEVKTEKQINVAAEDTEKNVAAAEAEILKDTVEWVESTKTPVSGSESYLLVDKNTIADPSQVSKAAARMLFDTLSVTLEPSNATLSVGSSIDLKGKEFANVTEGDIEYQYTAEWKSSNDSVASVSGGKVTARAAGEAVITYTVTRKTITTTYVSKEPVEEILETSVDKYKNELSETERGKCTEIKDDSGQITGYTFKKTTEQEPEKKTSETTESASAECKITVEPAKITSGSLELSKSADSCAVGATLTVKPSKLVYTKQDGSTDTLTSNFPSIAWESADKTIATVGTDGVVTGVKAGKVHITGRVTGVNGADGKELDIRCSVEISVTDAADLALTLDRTSDVYLAVGGSTTLVATVTNYKSDAGVTWETSDKNVATVNEKGVVTGVAAGSVKITATTKEKDKSGKQKQATCVVTVNSNATSDTTTKLKDKNGNQIYIRNSDGSYREAVYADYFTSSEFYIAAQSNYVYTGWQTINGKTYYYDKNGNVVTGTQIIQGVTYNFGTDGAIATTINGSTFGIDVSRHNGTIDWNAVKASGVDYVIIRCGYRGSSTGALIEDQNFRTNIKGATAAGLKVGVYVFSQAVNEVEAVKEASLAVSLVKGYNLTYPIFIDTEASGGRADKIDKATRTAVVNAFCQTVSSAGYQPGIYASKTWFEDKLNMGAVGSCRIWLAQYSAAPTYTGRKYDMWQYSSKGKISGISTAVDLNYSYLGY
ncbi:MAG: Ig-like domain-containing protein, partial [Lachnospiraceae bacterium]|nr:Ig-like domain-containing protein [Lachnospiraceae bacterium]